MLKSAPHTPVSPAPARNLVVALIDAHPKAILLLHAARKRAREVGGEWCVVYVDAVNSDTREDGSQSRLLRLCTLAEQMGGSVVQIPAPTLQDGLRQMLDRFRDQAAWVIIGSHAEHNGRAQRQRRTKLWQQTIDHIGAFAQVEMVPLGSASVKITREWGWMRGTLSARHFLYAVATVAVAMLAAQQLEAILPPALFKVNMQNVSLIFMTACAFTAGRYGLLPGLLAGVLGAGIYNYYYVPPLGMLRIETVTEALNMALFIFAAGLIALFTGRARSSSERSLRNERTTQVLFMLYRTASSAFSRQEALTTLQQKLTSILDIDVAFFLPPVMQPSELEIAVPEELVLGEIDEAAMQTCWQEMKATGLGTPSHAQAQWRFEPMVAQSGMIGVIAVRPRGQAMFEMWMMRLLSGIADQTALVIEHFELTRTMEVTRIREERESLRSMLLSSVSHDLKTPLAGIIGALSVHRSFGNKVSAEKRAELLDDALEEAQRLDSFITNILDITRLESGKVQFRPEWHEMYGIVLHVIKRMQHRLKGRKITLMPGCEHIEVCMDGLLGEQIIQNLIDNACKYTPEDTHITISFSVHDGEGFCCEVRDFGDGIPEEKLASIFDKYARIEKEDMQVAGTGLGLSICKAVLEAQGGWITAGNHPQGGAVFTFCYPQWRVMHAEDEFDEEIA